MAAKQAQVTAARGLSVPKSHESESRPIDLLAIEKELTQIAESREPREIRVRALLSFLLRLTNGLGIHYAEAQERQLVWREVLWKSADNGYQAPMLEALDGPMKQAVAKNTVVATALGHFSGHFTITVPVVHQGRIRGVVNLLLVAPTLDDIQPFVAVLQASLGFLHYSLLHDDARLGRQAVEQTAALVELSSLAASAPYFEEGMRILVERIQKHLGCHLVALGAVTGRRVVLQHVSGADQFDKWGGASSLIEAAMRDAVLADAPVEWPPKAGEAHIDASLTDVAQQELHHALGLSQVDSVPLRQADGKIVAVLTLMWKSPVAPSADSARFIEAATPHLGSLVGALRRADPGNTRKWWFHLWGGISRARKAVIAAVAVTILILLALPMHFPVKVDGIVEPAVRRVVSVQFDGILQESFVKPGDLVEANQLLAVMDDKQLVWRKAELIASRDRAIRQRDLAMADPRSAVATAQMAQLEADGFDLELRLIAFKEENLELRAPIDGMVLTGDLERARGIPVKQGDVLFEIGPTDRMIVQLMIPAYDISLVEAGDSLSLRLASFPGKTWHATLEKIHPQAETVDGKSVFIAEAVLSPEESVDLRPGMKGRASIRGETAPVAWVLTRRVWGFIQTTLFW
jgi:multidrug efflux pump subunit AcrA (membrane-fusion protein)